MTYLLICLTVFLVSGLTLFSGFGLGTVPMPAFALFFPLPVAIAATAVVHLANNLFKLALVGRDADWGVVWRFTLPVALAAIAGAFLGARLLKKVTLKFVQATVVAMMVVVGAGLAAGML